MKDTKDTPRISTFIYVSAFGAGYTESKPLYK